MIGSWWIIWFVFMLLFFVPMGYGWGHLGWGFPYPRYIQRRRGQAAAATAGSATFNHPSWGWQASSCGSCLSFHVAGLSGAFGVADAAMT